MTVHIIGNCTVDVFFEVERFPTAGETLLATSRYVDLGGKGANQAVVVARCGVRAVFVAPLGADGDGEEARQRLAGESLDLTHLLTVSAPTDQSIIYVRRTDAANCIVSSHAAAAALSPELCDPALKVVAPADLVLLQGNLSAATTRHCLAAARAQGATTILNPAPIAFDYGGIWPLVDVAIVNEVEACQLGRAQSPLEGGRNLAGGGVGHVIVTLGERGAVLLDGPTEVAVPAPGVEAVDTAGAGDVFCGVLTGALARGVTLTGAVEMAVEAASLAVTRRGTQSSFPTAEEIGVIFSRRHAIHQAGDAS